MKLLVISFAVLTFLLTACASSKEKAQVATLYNKYHAHCLEHAQKSSEMGSPDVEALYNECMDYFIGTDVHCPYCTTGLKK
jgi:uncharacterized lipoprotein